MNDALKKIAATAFVAMMAKTVEKAVHADALDLVEVGQTFDFDIVKKTKVGRMMVEAVLGVACHIELAKLMQHGPFTIVATYKGAMTDVVCQDNDGAYFMLPSGVFALLKRFESGDMPPELPVDLDAEALAKVA